MKNRHHVITVLFLILMVPFLFSSCGIPTEESFCSAEFLKMVNTERNETENSLNFKFKWVGNGSYDLSCKEKIDDGPSVLLFYVLCDDYSSLTSTYQNNIVSALNSKFDSEVITNFTKNKEFLTVDGFKVYPFLNSSEELPSAYFYNFNLGDLIFDEMEAMIEDSCFSEILSTNVKIETNNLSTDDTDQKGLRLKINATRPYKSCYKNLTTQTTSDTNLYLQDSTTPSANYAFIFGILYPGSPNLNAKVQFKIPSWSDAAYLGYIKLDKN